VKLKVIDGIPYKYIEIIAFSGVLAIFFYAAFFVDSTKVLLPMLALFAAAAYRLMPSMNRILVALSKIKANFYVFEILKQQTVSGEDRTDFQNVTSNLKFEKSIRFKDISYVYEKGQANVLD